MRAAVAILVPGLDAEEVVRGQLRADARERRLGVADLDGEERASSGARELFQPAPHERAVATPVDEALVGQSSSAAENRSMALVSIYKRVDRRVRERGFLAHLDAELAEIGTAARRVTRDHARR